jgi:arginyl-tRNA synthetase
MASWVSEESIHKTGKLEQVIKLLADKNQTYEADGALWFKSSELGDDKDRVLMRQGGAPTYLVPDIAYHKNKFDKNYDYIIDILGQDHHGYEKRLKASMQALGYDSNKLKIIFYQLVLLKEEDKLVRMSKRRGNFKSLSDVVETVGVDVARFFYLNKKVDAHLSFNLELALTKSNENPVYYIQYAYVRTNGILNKALGNVDLADYVKKLQCKNLNEVETCVLEHVFNQDEIELLKKVCSLRYTLLSIAESYQTHLLANYTFELAQSFHSFYNSHKIVDESDLSISRSRLLLVSIVRNTIDLCLDLLGLSKPSNM